MSRQANTTIYEVRSHLTRSSLLSRILLDGVETEQGFDVYNRGLGKAELITWGSLPTWVLSAMHEAIGAVLAQRSVGE